MISSGVPPFHTPAPPVSRRPTYEDKAHGCLEQTLFVCEVLQRLIIRFASGAEKLYQRPFIPTERRAMSHLPQLHEAIAAATKTLQSLVDLDAQIGEAADLIDQCLSAGNKLLVCGNGGSATDASHLATEFGRTFRQRSNGASGDLSRKR